MNRNAFVFTSLKTFNLDNHFLNFYLHYIYWNFKSEKESKDIHGEIGCGFVDVSPQKYVWFVLGLNLGLQESGSGLLYIFECSSSKIASFP